MPEFDAGKKKTEDIVAVVALKIGLVSWIDPVILSDIPER